MDRAEQQAASDELGEFLDRPVVKSATAGYINRHHVEPIELREVAGEDDDGPIEPLYMDSWNPDPWTYAAAVAALILAFTDEAQATDSPF